MNHQKILVSGIQPSNQLTLGNYLGAIKNFVKLQDQYQSFFFVADYHMLTVSFDPKELTNNSLEVIKSYLACGLDPNKCIFFYQSAIPEHLELCYLLLVHTSIGELSRMTQFKDKSQQITLKNKTNTVPTGLLIYPILMAADILIYDANLVPVGQDQKQHLELTRNIAIRINNKYQEKIFAVPEEYIFKVGSRIMDLQDPTMKMSKSSINPKGTIFLNDPIEVAHKKILQAKTDSLNHIKYDVINQPGVSNLIEIYCSLTDTEIDQFVASMANQTYHDLKQKVAETVCAFLTKIQNSYQQINDQYLLAILSKHHDQCRKIATAKVKKLQKIYGLYPI
ncbi:Tryptophanyl-tRNA synthetase [[Mycoplasma] cavipharyngis]|uniref:tryptophan--tRNA ligase n=1 Tax=[Mycoplasma] cavipharyngis TaxID=92757 RepID=UPI0037042432